jgi:hypothetical protein
MAQRDDGLDLSYLSDEAEETPKPPRSREVVAKGALGKDFYDKPKVNRQSGRTIGAVERGMAQMSLHPTPQTHKVEMATVDVKCNYAKDRVLVLAGGALIMKFDPYGICKMPVHQMELLQQVQRAKPGRFTVVKPEAPKAAPAPKVEAPKVAPAPKKVEAPTVEAQVVVEAPKTVEDEAPKKAYVKTEAKPEKKKKATNKKKSFFSSEPKNEE